MSRPRVTITLGRSGQVVKKGGDVVGGYGRVSKRFMEERWSNGVEDLMLKRKRQLGASAERGLGVNRRESGVAKNDLRLKLNRKRHTRQQVQSAVNERKNRGLHEQLFKSIPPPENHGMLPPRSELNRSAHFRQIPNRGTAHDLHPGDLLGKSFPSHTMTRTRRRSPERSSDEMWQKIPTGRDTNAPRAGFYSSISNIYASRHSGVASATVKAIPQSARPAAQVAPSNGMMQRGSYGTEELGPVFGLLHSLDLEKYYINFQREEVEMATLREMGEKDLKDMGIPMGPRKKILRALMPRPKQPPQNSFVRKVDNPRVM